MTTTKIGSDAAPKSAKSGKAKKEKKQRTPRPQFDLETAVDTDGAPVALDDKGRLTAVPTNWDRSCAPLKRASFSTPVLYAEFKLYLFDEATKAREAQRAELVSAVEEARLGKDSTAARSRKAAKLKAQLAALEAELLEAGVTLDD